MSLFTRVKTSFPRPSRECWREGEQWGAQPAPLSSACSRFHGPRRWFAFLGRQPALGKQETSRQASLLHAQWHAAQRERCEAAAPPRDPDPASCPLLPARCPTPGLWACARCPTWGRGAPAGNQAFPPCSLFGVCISRETRRSAVLVNWTLSLKSALSLPSPPVCFLRLSLQDTVAWSGQDGLPGPGNTDSRKYRSPLSSQGHLPF